MNNGWPDDVYFPYVDSDEMMEELVYEAYTYRRKRGWFVWLPSPPTCKRSDRPTPRRRDDEDPDDDFGDDFFVRRGTARALFIDLTAE